MDTMSQDLTHASTRRYKGGGVIGGLVKGKLTLKFSALILDVMSWSKVLKCTNIWFSLLSNLQ